MGLAERFKDKLANKDIFSRDDANTYTSEPITQNLSTNSSQNLNIKNFEDLESEIIDKIRKTPYWEEYSKLRQERMISAYFDKKVSSGKYSYLKISTSDSKFDFIQNILALANNR